jgi:hypothetical protein
VGEGDWKYGFQWINARTVGEEKFRETNLGKLKND